MNNEQKYKTLEERVEAFDSWRKTIKCEGCSQMCDTCEAGPLADECGFKWLALEAVGEEKVADCNHLGNAAKMRVALDKADKALTRISKSAWFMDSNLGETIEVMEAGKAITTALSAPPRNCDIYDAESCRMAYHLRGDGQMTMQAFADWLFAPAEEGAAS